MSQTTRSATSPRRRKKPLSFLWPKEVDQLLKRTKNPRDRAMLAMMARQGLRCNELRMLDLSDVRFEDRELWVRFAKGHKQRLLPLDPLVDRYVRAYIRQRPVSSSKSLFLSREGNRPSLRQLRTHVKRLGLRAGIKKDIHPHSLRHSYAVALADKGASLDAIRDLMGHESLATTSIYLHISANRLRAAQALLVDADFDQ
jgi:integrase/recombinase XerC